MKNGNGFHLFAENKNKKQKFVFLGPQTINSNRRLLFRQMCPSMGNGKPLINTCYLSSVANTSEDFVKGLPKLSNTLKQIVRYLPFTYGTLLKSIRRFQSPLRRLQQDYPIHKHAKGQPFWYTSEEHKIQIKSQ